MKLSCPVCDNSSELELIKGTKDILIRNEPVTIEMEYHKCSACGEEFIVPDSKNDPLELFGLNLDNRKVTHLIIEKVPTPPITRGAAAQLLVASVGGSDRTHRGTPGYGRDA